VGQAAAWDDATDDAALRLQAARVAQGALGSGRRVATAESCTGGWLAKCLTDIPGSSQWFERGYVTYSNAAKEQSLGVAREVIDTFGAVSRPTVEQMASGALHASGAQIAAAITGVAGPAGGTPAKPVGLVWIAVALSAPGGRIESQAEEHRFGGDRDAIRRASVSAALRLLARAAATPGAGREPAG
jgi:nicotinamide-nucleotide amidase